MAERPPCPADQAASWFTDQIPDQWFDAPIDVRCDRDEIVVTGRLADPGSDDPGPAGSTTPGSAGSGDHVARIEQFREQTRSQRLANADVGQQRWRRVVSWGAECGPVTVRFSNVAVPVMTRLRFDVRQVLDTLIDAGVARSRSEAMAWCVRQVGDHQSEWIERLRDAMIEVERIRNEGP
ncbi:MAG: hypothetical protein ACK5PP_16810 [Acidimicrobiales bacterium]